MEEVPVVPTEKSEVGGWPTVKLAVAVADAKIKLGNPFRSALFSPNNLGTLPLLQLIRVRSLMELIVSHPPRHQTALITTSVFVETLNKCQSWAMKTGLLIRDKADVD